MKIITRNIRGLNDLSKQRDIRSTIKRLNVKIFCILETRVQRVKAEKIHGAILPGWGWISNYDYHHLGRIWVCWDQALLKVDIISKSM